MLILEVALCGVASESYYGGTAGGPGSESEDGTADDDDDEDSGSGMTVTITGRLVMEEATSCSVDLVVASCEEHVTVVVCVGESVDEEVDDDMGAEVSDVSAAVELEGGVVVWVMGTGTGSNAGA